MIPSALFAFTIRCPPLSTHPLLSALYPLLSTLCSLPSALHPLLSTLCSLLSALYPLLSTLYPLPSTLYPLPSALCPKVESVLSPLDSSRSEREPIDKTGGACHGSSLAARPNRLQQRLASSRMTRADCGAPCEHRAPLSSTASATRDRPDAPSRLKTQCGRTRPEMKLSGRGSAPRPRSVHSVRRKERDS